MKTEKIKIPVLSISRLNVFGNMRFICALSKAFFYDLLLRIKITPRDIFLAGDQSQFQDKVHYQPAFYGRLEKAAKYLQFEKDDVFVDLGCGEGRVVCFMATFPIKKCIGVELEAEFFFRAQQNALCMRGRKAEIEIIHQDAALFNPCAGTIFYIYNAFGRRTLEAVVENIRESLKSKPRKLRIIYYNPVYGEVLDQQDWLHRETSIENKRCIVWGNGESITIKKDFLLENFELKEAVLDGNLFTFKSTGLCMYPSFKEGDKVTVKSRKPEEFTVGDIAVFRRSGNLCAHRVIRTGVGQSGPYIVTQPDVLLNKEDGLIFEPDILGAVISVERNGKLFEGFKKKYSWIQRITVFVYLLWCIFMRQLGFLIKKMFRRELNL